MKVEMGFSAAVALFFAAGLSFSEEANTTSNAKFEPTWESLSRHEAAPEWMKDAKLGIYFHWGPYSVPAYHNEWYPRNMYIKNDPVFNHHKKTWGDQAEFSYHDFIPMFTAEKFNPEEWAQLFYESGAKFAGPVAEHHDGFSMWDSKVTPWNAKNMGPKRDILGELFTSLRKRDMKTIATFHHARNLQRSQKDGYSEIGGSHFPFNPEWATGSNDPKLQLLYGNMDPDEWHEKVWLGKLVEVIDRYQPDAIWFDSWLNYIPEEHRQRFCAYYLNAAQQWGKEVAIIRKQDDLPLDFSINDHEKAREAKALPELWMTDDTISTGSWCFTDNLKIKPLYKVVHALIDTVSKNGVVLLNLSPKADGSIPEDQQNVLRGLGQWLQVYGEGIYNTRPWIIAAEGLTEEPDGGFRDRDEFLNLEYSSKDVRYTASKDGKTVYAFIMGDGLKFGQKIVFEAFKGLDVEIAGVEKLYGGDSVKWALINNKGLRLMMPQSKNEDRLATVFKISLK